MGVIINTVKDEIHQYHQQSHQAMYFTNFQKSELIPAYTSDTNPTFLNIISQCETAKKETCSKDYFGSFEIFKNGILLFCMV